MTLIKKQLQSEQKSLSQAHKKMSDLEAKLDHEKKSLERFLLTVNKEEIMEQIKEYEAMD